VPVLIAPYTPHLYFERSPQRNAHRCNIPLHATVTLISALPYTNATFSALHSTPPTAGGAPTCHPHHRMAIHQRYPLTLSAALHTANSRRRTNTRPYCAAASLLICATAHKCVPRSNHWEMQLHTAPLSANNAHICKYLTYTTTTHS
jgi:hypothetical protein